VKTLVLLALLFAVGAFAQQPPTNSGAPAPTPVAAIAPAPAPAVVVPKPPSEDFLRDYDYAVTLNRAIEILKEQSGVRALEKQVEELMKKLRAQLPLGHDFDPQQKAWVKSSPPKQEPPAVK